MKFAQAILTASTLSMLAFLAACSSGNSTTHPTPVSISVAQSGAPANITVNGSASITATVINDSAGGGVTWSCAPSGSCGTFNPTTTASGAATVYTAPAAIPSGGTVTVTATSVTDTTKSAAATITVNPIPLADGNYVFTISGLNGNLIASNVVGVFTISGGLITAGEQDYVDSAPTSDLHDAINPTGSFVTTTADGNLEVILVTCLGQCSSGQTDTVIGGGTGFETLSGSIINTSTCATAGGPCRARVIELDQFATGSGTLELQDTTAAVTAPTGPHIFGIQGVPGLARSIGGILNISGTTVSPTGTVFDLNNGGAVSSAETVSAGSVTAPDNMGRLQITMTPTDTAIPPLSLASYAVDASHAQIIQATAPLGGTAFAQAASPSASGDSYSVGLTGGDQVGPLQAAGILTLAQASTGVTGTISYNDLVNLTSSAVAVTGTYTADATNAGRYTLNSLTDGTNTFDMALYIDGNGNAVEVSITPNVVLEGVGTQSASGTFSGTYVMAATGFDGSVMPVELDAVGQVTTGSGTFSGFADFNWFGDPAPTPNLGVSGAFTTPATGVSTGTGNTLTGLDALLGSSQADVFDYYQADANTVIGIEVDANQNTLATFDLTQ
jgi:hypothetical protein